MLKSNGNHIMLRIIPASCALGKSCCIKYYLTDLKYSTPYDNLRTILLISRKILHNVLLPILAEIHQEN